MSWSKLYLDEILLAGLDKMVKEDRSCVNLEDQKLVAPKKSLSWRKAC